MISRTVIRFALVCLTTLLAPHAFAQVDSTGVSPLKGTPSIDCNSPWAAAMCKSVTDKIPPPAFVPQMDACPNGTYVVAGTNCSALATGALPQGSTCGAARGNVNVPGYMSNVYPCNGVWLIQDVSYWEPGRAAYCEGFGDGGENCYPAIPTGWATRPPNLYSGGNLSEVRCPTNMTPMMITMTDAGTESTVTCVRL